LAFCHFSHYLTKNLAENRELIFRNFFLKLPGLALVFVESFFQARISMLFIAVDNCDRFVRLSKQELRELITLPCCHAEFIFWGLIFGSPFPICRPCGFRACAARTVWLPMRFSQPFCLLTCATPPALLRSILNKPPTTHCPNRHAKLAAGHVVDGRALRHQLLVESTSAPTRRRVVANAVDAFARGLSQLLGLAKDRGHADFAAPEIPRPLSGPTELVEVSTPTNPGLPRALAGQAYDLL